MNKSQKITTIAFVFLVCLCIIPASGQANAPMPAASPDKPIVSETYFLMPGDSILVTISGATNYSYATVITFEGKVFVKMPVSTMVTAEGIYQPKYDIVEAVPLYGMSLKAGRDSLQKVFNKYFRNVMIAATLIKMRTIVLYVVGEVRNPGTVQAYPIDRVSEAVRNAGGISTLGSRSKIQLQRNGSVQQVVNLEKFQATGDVAANPYVQDGDVIFVPKMEQSVIVQGAVFGKGGYELRVSQMTAAMERTSEGLYELEPGERVANLVVKAGGTTPWADLKQAYITRADNKIPIDLSRAVITPDDTLNNRALSNGDVIVVPSINALVYVQGQVVNPGSFAYQPNLKALDYIGLAGGPTVDASQSGARVYRGKKRISISHNPIIEPGDRVYVPRQVFKFWQDYVEILSVGVSILIAYLTLQK